MVWERCLAGVLGPVCAPPCWPPWPGGRVWKLAGLGPLLPLFSSLMPSRWKVAYGLMSSSWLGMEPPTGMG